MRIVTTLILVFISLNLHSQIDSLNIVQCRKLVKERYPLIENYQYNKETYELKIKNIKTIYLPGLNLTGQFVHLADVPHLTVDNPLFNIPVVDKNQYKVQLEAKQVVYDGGLTKRMKALEESSYLLEDKNVEVNLYGLNEQVNELYFLVLLFQEQVEILELTKATINEQLRVVESGVRNGVLMPGDADVIKAELLKLEQSMTELNAGRVSGLEVLSELMDTTINEDVVLKQPKNLVANTNLSNARPEYELMELQSRKIGSASKLNDAYRYPIVALFGNIGYGYPGMNMMEDKADVIYSFGVSFSWKIWDWGKVKRERQVNKIMQEKISVQRKVFDENIRVANKKVNNNIKKLDAAIAKDDEIIALRERISKTKESQLKNGVITSSAYLIELNAETQAKMNKQLHEIQRLKEIVAMQTINGDID